MFAPYIPMPKGRGFTARFGKRLFAPYIPMPKGRGFTARFGKKASTWIAIAIVAAIILFNLLNPKAFGLFWLGLSLTVFVSLLAFHVLNKHGKMY